MKTFHFRLQTVLNLRAQEEDQAQNAYAQSLHARARIESDIRQAGVTLDGFHAALRTAREGTSNPQHQLIFLKALQRQHTLCDRLASDLSSAEREVAKRREAMLEARRRRETLARLKEKQQGVHRADAARVEESMVGDLITARHVLRMMEAAA